MVGLESLLLVFLGLLVGMIVGVLPGLSATMGVAILMPLTFAMSPENGIATLLGVYCGSIYAGSISAILVNIPGTPAAIATNFDGHPLAKRGEAGRAIGMATVSSFIGGTASVFVLIFLAPQVANFALSFGPPEFFALAVFGLSIIGSISGDSLSKGLVAGCIGLFLATVGMDPISSHPRYIFGRTELLSGVLLVPVLLGLFGLAEVLAQLNDKTTVKVLQQKLKNLVPSLVDMKKCAKTIVRGTIIGTVVGAIPAAGAPIASLLSYNEAKRNSKDPDSFGKGNIEGIAAPESANNASTGGALIPLLTLCIPGDGVTAILLGAFMVHNITPGPLLFQEHPALIKSIYSSLIFANFGILVCGLLLAGFFARLISIPRYYLLPTITLLSIVGTYSLQNNIFDVWIMIFFGVIGYILNFLGIPFGPIILGLILGPIAESNFRRSVIMSDGNLTIFFTRPISLLLLVVTVLILVSPVLKKHYTKKKQMSAHGAS